VDSLVALRSKLIYHEEEVNLWEMLNTLEDYSEVNLSTGIQLEDLKTSIEEVRRHLTDIADSLEKSGAKPLMSR